MLCIGCASLVVSLTITTGASLKIQSSTLVDGQLLDVEGGVLDCLRADRTPREAPDRLTHCVDVQQNRCEVLGIRAVTPHPYGFASAMNSWVLSFVYVLQSGQVWLPRGPFVYNDPSFCNREAGLQCYYENVSSCSGRASKVISASRFLYKNPKKVQRQVSKFLYEVADLLGVSRSWVWGHLARHALRMTATTNRSVMARTPRFNARHTLGIQYRSGSSTVPLYDERHHVGIDRFLEHAEKLTKNQTNIHTIYLMTDSKNLSVDCLKARQPTIEFLMPDRQVADLSWSAPPGGIADLTYDLMADIEAMVQTEVFIGTQSNIFWLIYALREARANGPGMACWVDTKDSTTPLRCPGDAGFWLSGPPVS
jgi:hypothetical protein